MVTPSGGSGLTSLEGVVMNIIDNTMTVSEAAKTLGVSRTTIHRWINEQRLSAFRVGSTFRIYEEEILDLVQPV